MFNGSDLSALVYCKVRRPIMATVSPSFETVPGRHGEVFKTVTRSGYDLPVEIWLRTEDRREVAEVRHRLAELLWTDEPAPLYLPDDPTRYLMAIVSGDTDLDEITDDCPTTTLTFRIGDPDYYGQARRLDAKAGNVSFAVGGTRPTFLRITAKPGAVSSFKVTNTDTAEHVEVKKAMTASSVLRIDMETERATVNQQTAPVTIDSDFFEVSGRAHLALTAAATIEWVERWL